MENDAFMRRLSTATHTELIRANNLAHIKLYERLERLEQADKGLASAGYDNQSNLHKRVSEKEKEKDPQFYVYAEYLILTMC
jgi:hypothetical protein